MTEQSPEKPKRSRRIYVYWGVALALLIAAGLVCWKVVVPVWQVHSELQEDKQPDPLVAQRINKRLSRPQPAGRAVSLYLRVPRLTLEDRRKALYVLGWCRCSSGVGALRSALQASEPEIRAEAAWSLAIVGPAATDAVPDLTEALSDKNGRVRCNAAVALGAMGPGAASAVPALMRAMRGEDSNLRWHSVEALGRIGAGARKAVPELVKLAQEPNSELQSHAVSAIVRIGASSGGVEALIKLLAQVPTTDHMWTSAVMHELRAIGATALPALRRALDDENEKVRRAALLGLLALGPEAGEAVPAVRAALVDKDPKVRQAAAEALKKIRAAEKKKDAGK